MNKFVEAYLRACSDAKLGFKKNAPALMMIGGAIGVVAATVLACKATRKLDDVIDETKEQIDDIHETHATTTEDVYPDVVYKKDITKCYIKTGLEIAKLYAPAVILGGLSLGAMFASNNEYKKRNASLAAAYATLDSMFRSYRKNVVEELGEDADRRFRYGIKKEKIEEEVTDSNTGKTKKVKKEVETIKKQADGYSDYAKFFDSTSLFYEDDPEYNLNFVKLIQAHANDKLKVDKVVFLNDVYEMLGLPKTKAGHSVGWYFDLKNPHGANFIDFGIYKYSRPNALFVNGYEPVILLDFNVDPEPVDKYLA